MNILVEWAGPFVDVAAIAKWLESQTTGDVPHILKPRAGLYVAAGTICPADPEAEWKPGRVFDQHLAAGSREDFTYDDAPQVVYIGRSNDLGRRMDSHLRAWSAGLDYVQEGDWGLWLALPRLDGGLESLPLVQRNFVAMHGFLPWLENALIHAMLQDNAIYNGDYLQDGLWFAGAKDDRLGLCNGRDYGEAANIQVRFVHAWPAMTPAWATRPIAQIHNAFVRIEKAGSR